MGDSARNRVLLAGATGFIGRHVFPALAAAGYDIVCASRDPESAAQRLEGRSWVRFDVEARESLAPALSGCDAVLYLVHQMGGGPGYAERELQAARWLREAAAESGVRRIVYLGGVAPTGRCSPHLHSRLQTGECLRQGSVTTVELRAGMIIGAGSASWLIVRDLAERLPAMLLPRWLGNRSSPVAIDDVVAALLWALGEAPEQTAWYELPGAEVMSHRALIERVAQVLGRHPAIVEVPMLTPALSSYWIAMVTRTGLGLARELVQGLQSDLLPVGTSVWSLASHHRLRGLEEAARYALADERTSPRGQVSAATRARLESLGRAIASGAAA